MECDKFVLEKLEGGDSPAFREHRAVCGGCARDVEEIGDVRRLYHEAVEEDRWRGGVPALPRRASTAWMPVAAAAAVMLALVAGYFRTSEETGSTTTAEPPSAFFRVKLEPWDREEHRMSTALDEAWNRLDRLERSAR